MRTLSISTSRATIDIQSTRAQLEIKNTVRRHFTSKRTPPQMTVTNTRPKMRVDWKQVWAHRGMRSPDNLRRHQVQQGYQEVQQYIQKTVQDGDFMGALEQFAGDGVNRVGQWAYQEMMQDRTPDLNVAQPMPMPDVEWETGSTKIDWVPGDLEIVWDEAFRPQLTVTPHSVEIRLNGRNEVHVSVNEEQVSDASGKKVDRRI